MTFKSNWEKITTPSNLDESLLRDMVKKFYPDETINNVTPLNDGCSNINVRVDMKKQSVLLRIYMYTKALQKEQELLSVLHEKLPVPKFLHSGELQEYPYIITEFLEGTPLREHLLEENCDIKDIMRKVGITLARIHEVDLKTLSLQKENEESLKDYALNILENDKIKKQLSKEDIYKITILIEEYHSLISSNSKSLTHADFDPANILVKKTNGSLEITGIIDWEYSFIGNPLFDMANMLRYAHQMPKEFQSYFLQGLLSEGYEPPKNWQTAIKILNLISLLDCLNRSSLDSKPNRVKDILEVIQTILSSLKTIKVLKYNPKWPETFKLEKQKIIKHLGDECIEIHHIGSTSIPELSAKEDIDILLVIKNLKKSLPLKEIGYKLKGELNIPLRFFFSKNTKESKVNLHVCEQNHGFIDLNLSFRNWLRSNTVDKDKYQKLKEEILKSPLAGLKLHSFLSNYSNQKNDFIKNTIQKSGYNKIHINFCLHDEEFLAAKKLRGKYFKTHLHSKDKELWTFENNEHKHFVLYEGVEIKGYAHVDMSSKKESLLKVLYIDSNNHLLEEKLLATIEEWLSFHNFSDLKSIYK